MSRWEKCAVVTAISLMILSGSAYFVIKYWIVNADPFSVVNHPLEPVALKTHILAGPFLIFIFGLLFRSHVRDMFKRRSESARTGGLLTAILFVLTVSSGYLLQTVTAQAFHEVLVYVHVLGGLCFGLVFGIHSIYRRIRSRRTVRLLTGERRLVA